MLVLLCICVSSSLGPPLRCQTPDVNVWVSRTPGLACLMRACRLGIGACVCACVSVHVSFCNLCADICTDMFPYCVLTHTFEFRH